MEIGDTIIGGILLAAILGVYYFFHHGGSLTTQETAFGVGGGALLFFLLFLRVSILPGADVELIPILVGVWLAWYLATTLTASGVAGQASTVRPINERGPLLAAGTILFMILFGYLRALFMAAPVDSYEIVVNTIIFAVWFGLSGYLADLIAGQPTLNYLDAKTEFVPPGPPACT